MRTQSLIRRSLIGLLTVGCLGSAWSQATNVAQEPMREVNVAQQTFSRVPQPPSWVVDVAPPPAATKQEGVVVRLADTQFRVDEEPAFFVERAVQVFDASRLSQAANLSFEFVPQYNRIVLHKLQVVRDGVISDRLEKAAVRFLQREAGLEGGVYSGLVTGSIILDDVRVGDTVVYSYTQFGQNPVLGPKFVNSASWDLPDAVGYRRVVLSHPIAREVRWQMLGDQGRPNVSPTKRQVGQWTQLVFEGRDLAPLAPEPGQPSDFVSHRFLNFTEHESWQSVARWANELFSLDAALPPELTDLIQQWKKLETDEDKILAALGWIQEEIRYFSISLGESSHRPYPADQVLKRRYGDCKDKTQMLVATLKQLGIDAEPILVRAQYSKFATRALPSPLIFDHVVAQVRLNGKTFYLDPTRPKQSSKLQYMGWPLYGTPGLVASKQAVDLVTMQPDLAPIVFLSTVNDRFEIDQFTSHGTLEVTHVFHGTSAETLRFFLKRVTPREIALEILGPYQRRYPGVKISGEPVFDDSLPFNSISFRAKLTGAFAREFQQEWAVAFFPSNLHGAIPIPERVTRNSPIALFAVPFELRYTNQITWPAEVQMLSDPARQKVDSKFFEAQINRQFRGNTSTQNITFKPRQQAVSPAEIPDLLDDVRKLERAISGAVVVDKTALRTATKKSSASTDITTTLKDRLEKTVANITRAIDGGQLSDDDLAIAYCDRAAAYSDLGKSELALADADNAIRRASNLPDVFDCRAAAHFGAGNFSNAIADYTRALGLGAEPANTLYRRGLARFYAKDFNAAIQDLRQAIALKEKIPEGNPNYAVMWYAWAVRKAGRTVDPAVVASYGQPASQSVWPAPAVRMALGQASPEQVIAFAESKTGDERSMTLAEAWFYVGQQHALNNETRLARAAFEKTRSLGVIVYIEHWAAGFELKQLSDAQ